MKKPPDPAHVAVLSAEETDALDRTVDLARSAQWQWQSVNLALLLAAPRLLATVNALRAEVARLTAERAEVDVENKKQPEKGVADE